MRPSGTITATIAVLMAPLFASGQTHVRWPAGSVLSDVQLSMLGKECFFWVESLDDELFARIDGASYSRGCTTPRSALRCLHLLHRNFGGHIQVGEMICAVSVADELLDIFRELFEAGYPIEKICLVDEFGGDDLRSMEANNTSCFNFRPIAAGGRLSNHALGLAVDINPLYNPYVKGTVVKPAASSRYADRTLRCPYYIRRGDLCHSAFTSRGWHWGGSWNSMKDYQHFEKKQ